MVFMGLVKKDSPLQTKKRDKNYTIIIIKRLRNIPLGPGGLNL